MSGFVLHLLRHGAPDTPGLLMGRTDGAPTPAGIAACAAQAAGLGIEHIFASDLGRSRAAGEAISRALALPLTIDPRWRELDFGDWDGRASGEVDRDALGRFWDDPDASPPPGGERWSALVARVAAALADLAPVRRWSSPTAVRCARRCTSSAASTSVSCGPSTCPMRRGCRSTSGRASR